ncbi:hypothetical protein CANCADRAFT_31562, partial [Tortispora caseinolytica NRRL Y-17796]
MAIKVVFAFDPQTDMQGSSSPTKVQVAGEFSDWKPVDLSNSGDTYKVEIALEPGKSYSYKYIVDDQWVLAESQRESR